MTVLLYQYGYSEALTFNQSIDLYRIFHSTESQHHQAIGLFNLFGKNRKITFVDALSRVLISGELKDMPALSFDKDFKSLGLTTISWTPADLWPLTADRWPPPRKEVQLYRGASVVKHFLSVISYQFWALSFELYPVPSCKSCQKNKNVKWTSTLDFSEMDIPSKVELLCIYT